MENDVMLGKLSEAKFLNLIICFIVVGSGACLLYVLDQKWKGKYRFLYRAFTCWWLSWVAWIAAWVLIKLSLFEKKALQEVLSLILSDLNAIFLFLVYFNLTRGNQFRIKDALYRSSIIILALAISFWALRFYIPSPEIANDLQQSLELCMGVIATMLLGWAFALRYNTIAVLGVGFVYGFLQPIAYMAIFHEDKFHLFPELFITAIITLAFMKIALATVVTWYFMQVPESTESLVKQSKSHPHSGLFQGKTKILELQTLILVGAFIFFLSLRMQDFVDKAAKLITQVLAVYGVLLGVVKLWSQYTSKQAIREDAPKIGKAG